MEDKKEIIEKFVKAVKVTRAGSGVKNIVYRKDAWSEYVDIEFYSGSKHSVNVSADSGAAMLREVLNYLLG